MHKTYLIELLQKLSSKQMKELSEFIQSPFFNKNESVTRLFEYLRVQHPEFKQQNISKEYIHKKVFLSAEYNDGFMRTLTFRLVSLAEEYFAYSQYKTNESAPQLYLISRLLDMNLDQEAQKQISQLEKKLGGVEIPGAEFYRNVYDLEKYKDVIYSRSYRAITVKDKPDEKLLGESNNLTAFFLISVLERYRYLLNKSFTVNTKYDPEFLPDIIRFLEGKGKHYLEIKLISLLYRQILVLSDLEREDLLNEIIDELRDENEPIDDTERREGLTAMANICIEKGYAGREEYYKKMLDIDKYLIAKNLYNRVKGGYFENEMFINVTTLGLKLNEVEWTNDFIEKYYTKLAPENKLNSYNYSKSKLYFKMKDFEKALDSISRVNSSDLHMKMNVRITAITIHYELGNIEEVLTQIDNFKKYIQNDKLLSLGHKKISSNFIKFTAALCKAKYSPKAKLDELKKSITASDQISNRVWLLAKAEELVGLRRSMGK